MDGVDYVPFLRCLRNKSFRFFKMCDLIMATIHHTAYHNVHFIAYKSGICQIGARTFSSSENQIYCQMVYFYKVITRLQAYVRCEIKTSSKSNSPITANEPSHKGAQTSEKIIKCAHTHTSFEESTFWHLDLFWCIRLDQREMETKYKWNPRKSLQHVLCCVSHFHVSINAYISSIINLRYNECCDCMWVCVFRCIERRKQNWPENV